MDTSGQSADIPKNSLMVSTLKARTATSQQAPQQTKKSSTTSSPTGSAASFFQPPYQSLPCAPPPPRRDAANQGVPARVPNPFTKKDIYQPAFAGNPFTEAPAHPKAGATFTPSRRLERLAAPLGLRGPGPPLQTGAPTHPAQINGNRSGGPKALAVSVASVPMAAGAAPSADTKQEQMLLMVVPPAQRRFL